MIFLTRYNTIGLLCFLTISLLLMYVNFLDHSHNTRLSGRQNIINNSNIKLNDYATPKIANYLSKYNNRWIEKMEKRYTQINRRIEEVCEKSHFNYATTTPYEKKSFFRHFVLDSSHRLGFCNNHKVGSTTTMHYIEKFINSSFLKKGIDIHDSIHKALQPSKDKIIESIINDTAIKVENTSFIYLFNRAMQQNRILTFSFVRHPHERLVSAYRDKILGGEGRCKKFLSFTFPEFINHVLDEYKYDTHIDNCNTHWRAFASRCFYCNFKYNVIGTNMETLNEHYKYIILKQKLENIIPLEKISATFNRSGGKAKTNQWNKGKQKRNALTKKHIAVQEYFSQLSKGQIKAIHDLYRLDFELFDYEPEKYII